MKEGEGGLGKHNPIQMGHLLAKKVRALRRPVTVHDEAAIYDPVLNPSARTAFAY